MALNTTKRGAVHSQVLPFPLDESRASTVTALDELLGKVFDVGDGLQAILVQADVAQTSPAKLCFKWQDQDAFEVVITSSTGDRAVGVAHPSLGDLAANDYFFLLRGVGGRVTCVDSGAGITKAAFVQPTANGEVITDAAAEPGVSMGSAEATAAADADVNVLLMFNLTGLAT